MLITTYLRISVLVAVRRLLGTLLTRKKLRSHQSASFSIWTKSSAKQFVGRMVVVAQTELHWFAPVKRANLAGLA